MVGMMACHEHRLTPFLLFNRWLMQYPTVVWQGSAFKDGEDATVKMRRAEHELPASHHMRKALHDMLERSASVRHM